MKLSHLERQKPSASIDFIWPKTFRIFEKNSSNMKPLTKEQVREIAEQIDCGFQCFWNTKNNALVFIPDELSHPFMEMEFWEEEYREIEKHPKDYVEIERPHSSDSFRIMVAFTESLPDDLPLKDRLFRALNRRKPFREFKFGIDSSGGYREEWFGFKDSKLREWVADRIEEIIATER